MSSPILCDGCGEAEAAFLVGQLDSGEQTAACLLHAPDLFRNTADAIEAALSPALVNEQEQQPEEQPEEQPAQPDEEQPAEKPEEQPEEQPKAAHG